MAWLALLPVMPVSPTALGTQPAVAAGSSSLCTLGPRDGAPTWGQLIPQTGLNRCQGPMAQPGSGPLCPPLPRALPHALSPRHAGLLLFLQPGSHTGTPGPLHLPCSHLLVAGGNGVLSWGRKESSLGDPHMGGSEAVVRFTEDAGANTKYSPGFYSVPP